MATCIHDLSGCFCGEVNDEKIYPYGECTKAEMATCIHDLSGCFCGEVNDEKLYPYGVYTKAETDEKIAELTNHIESKAEKSETYNKQEVDEKIKNVEVDAYTKSEADGKFATNEDLRELGEETAQQLADFDSEKADKTALQSLESLVNTKASGAELAALTQAVESKADKTAVQNLSESVETKADKTELATMQQLIESKADKTAVQNLSESVETKADAAATAQELKAQIDNATSKIESLKTVYEAGEGIEIIGSTVVSDNLPVKLYSNSKVLSQYIIQGAEGGVGDYKSQYGTYDFMIQVQANDEVAAFKIGLPTPLYENSYIDFKKQKIVTLKTKITVTKQTQIFGETYYLAENGEKEYYWNWRRENIGVVSKIPVIENHQYSLLVTAPKQVLDINDFYHCWYDADYNFISAFKPLKDNVQLVVAPQGACYLSLTVDVDMHDFGAVTLYDMTAITTPVELPEVVFYPNTINTISINSSIQPGKVMFETDTNESQSGEESAMRILGKIINKRKIVTQVEYDALNEKEKNNGTLYLIIEE